VALDHKLNENGIPEDEEIKNSPNQDPEGYWTVRIAAMCNAGFVL
jgi:hypothetical protein